MISGEAVSEVGEGNAVQPAGKTLPPITAGSGELVTAEARASALEALAARADDHALAARSTRTRAAYAADWAHFTSWCDAAGLDALPAVVDTVRLYLTDLEATRDGTGAVVFAPATMARRLAAIASVHRDGGHPSPTRDPRVGAVLTGIRRARAHDTYRMRPLLLGDLRLILGGLDYGTWPAGVTAARDAFVLLAGFAGALRRSELAALTVADLTWVPDDGLHLRVQTSKTDQESVGATIALPYGQHPGTCPPCAALRWLRMLDAVRHGRDALMRAVLGTPAWDEQRHLYPHPGPDRPQDPGRRSPTDVAGAAGEQHDYRAPAPSLPREAPLLRGVRKGGQVLERGITGDALHAMVTRRAAATGIDGPIGFHSLRAGFVTQARRGGAEHRAVRRQTRHGSDAMVELYDRDHTPLAGNAVTMLGL